MKEIQISDATSSLAKYAKKVKREPFLITSHGVPMAVLVSVSDIDMETFLVSMNEKFQALMERSRLRHRNEGGISPKEMRKSLGL
jgi:prevent-host-death family protein